MKPKKDKQYVLWDSHLACDCGCRVSKVLKIARDRGDHLIRCVGCNNGEMWYHNNEWIYISKKIAKVLYL